MTATDGGSATLYYALDDKTFDGQMLHGDGRIVYKLVDPPAEGGRAEGHEGGGDAAARGRAVADAGGRPISRARVRPPLRL